MAQAGESIGMETLHILIYRALGEAMRMTSMASYDLSNQRVIGTLADKLVADIQKWYRADESEQKSHFTRTSLLIQNEIQLSREIYNEPLGCTAQCVLERNILTERLYDFAVYVQPYFRDRYELEQIPDLLDWPKKEKKETIE